MTAGAGPFHVLIPARYASTRLPGKPLADIGGAAMVVRVCERAIASGASSVHVATDDARIESVVRAAGHRAVMTRHDHATGTDRIAEAAASLGLLGDEIIVNVQGDEPLIDPRLIEAVATRLRSDPRAVMASACHPIATVDEMTNPNVVKVVLDAAGAALYFSRAPIPWHRDGWAGGGETSRSPTPGVHRRHIGIYAYRAEFLSRYARLDPSPLERIESLEQLRVLWHGERIAMFVTRETPAPGVDSQDDLERVRKIRAAGG